jgi:phage baseplate assembly protein V
LRVRNMVKHAVVGAVDDTGHWQRAQIEMLDSEVRNGIPVFQHYGFASNPPVGDADNPEALVVHPGGRPDSAVIIGIGDRRYRIRNLSAQEVCVYDAQGSTLKLKANGDIEATPASGTMKINANTLNIGGDVTVAGDLHATGTIKGDTDVVAHSATLGADISLNSHAHNVSAVDGNTLSVVFTPPGKTGSPT